MSPHRWSSSSAPAFCVSHTRVVFHPSGFRHENVCRRITRPHRGGGIPVRPTCHKTIRTGNRDLFIAEVFETPVNVESPRLYIPSGGDIEIAPNPSRKEFRFSTPGEGAAEVLLYDFLGWRMLRKTALAANGMIKGVLNTTGLQAGFYLLVVRTSEGLRTGEGGDNAMITAGLADHESR